MRHSSFCRDMFLSCIGKWESLLYASSFGPDGDGEEWNMPSYPFCLSHCRQSADIWSMTLDYPCHFFRWLCWGYGRIMKSFRPLKRFVTTFNLDNFSTDYHHFSFCRIPSKGSVGCVNVWFVSFRTDLGMSPAMRASPAATGNRKRQRIGPQATVTPLLEGWSGVKDRWRGVWIIHHNFSGISFN